MPDEVAVTEETKSPTKRRPGRPKKKAGRPRRNKAAKRKAGRPKKEVASGGWPKGKKRGKKRGRPAKKVMAVKKAGSSISLPASEKGDFIYWSEFIEFLNDHSGKKFRIQTDGVSFDLHAS